MKKKDCACAAGRNKSEYIEFSFKIHLVELIVCAAGIYDDEFEGKRKYIFCLLIWY